jgi:hypothetical protein
MSETVRLKYSVPGCTAKKMRTIDLNQTIREVIFTIAKLDSVDVDELSLENCVLPGDEAFRYYCDPPGQFFVFSKSSSVSPSTLAISNPLAKEPRPACNTRRTSSAASEDDPYAVIGNDASNRIRFNCYLFSGCSLRYFEQLQADPSDRDLRFDGSFKRDSVVQFLNLCQAGRRFTLTRQNIFEVELLCKEWEITEPRVLDEVGGFIRNPPGGGNLTVTRLLFCLGRGLATHDLEDEVRGRLAEFAEDDELVQVPLGVLVRIADFGVYLGDSVGHDRVLDFCIKYCRKHGAESSQIFRTLDAGRLGPEQLERLYQLEGVRWRWQDWSVISSLIEARRLLKQQEQEMAELKDVLKSIVLHPERANACEIIRRIFPDIQFPPWVKKGRITLQEEEQEEEEEKEEEIDVPDGIIAHLTRECGGNVHDRHVIDVTSGSFETETEGANPHSGAWNNAPNCAAKNAVDLEADSLFQSAYRTREEDIPHRKNNWLCYDFKERRIAPTHYTIRSYWGVPGDWHLKSWIVETSADGESWREVAHEENNERLNGSRFTGTFTAAGGGACRLIRLVNIGKNHQGSDQLVVSAWEIFGNVIE